MLQLPMPTSLLARERRGDVSGDFADAVAAINRHNGRVIALDIPTGLHGDSGLVMGAAVQADMTVTFVGLKAGLFRGAGPDLCGDIEFAGLGIDDHIRAAIAPEFRRLTREKIRLALPRRDRNAHKGDSLRRGRAARRGRTCEYCDRPCARRNDRCHPARTHGARGE
jgi:NAD(P)H-hydrate epimerase